MKERVKALFVNNREKVYLFVAIAVFLGILLSNFVRVHYATDTYCLLSSGYREYASVFLSAGRPISAISLAVFACLKLSLKTYIVFMGFMAIIELSLSICILFYTIIGCLNIKGKKPCALILMFCLVTVVNFCSMDILVFAESGILALGVLSAVISACFWGINCKFKYIFAVLFGLLSVLCHQAVFNLYVPVALLIVVLKNRDSVVKALKNAFLALSVYGIGIIASTLITSVISKIFSIQSRATSFANIKNAVETYRIYLRVLVVNTLDIGHKYWYIILMLIITLFFVIYIFKNKEKKVMMFYYFSIWLSTIMLPILPLILIDPASQYIEPRMCLSFGAGIGIMAILCISIMNFEIDSGWLKNIFKVFAILLFVFNFRYVERSSSEMVATNIADRNMIDSIIYKMYEYESQNNIKIKYIGIAYDQSSETYYHGEGNYRCLNTRALVVDWAICPLIYSYTGERLLMVEVPPDVHNKYFFGRNWTSYNEEQIVFEGETMYLCVY